MTNELAENNLDNTIEILLQHCKNKNKFKKDANLIATGGEDHSDYTNKGIRRSRISKKEFNSAIFKNSAAACSVFHSCKFNECQMINANFQECTFIASRILNNPHSMPISHCNFNESLFSDEFVIDNIYFEHSVFYNTAFIGGTIKDTTFYSCTLEGTTFSDVTFENVQFTDLNIDYAIFENVHMNNVILPFSQICYTFGLLSYLQETSDNVYITSVSNENGYISKEEFLDLIPHFINYYVATKDYFPLANIYFFWGYNDKAKQTICSGILQGIAEIDFRKIKYLCKLIYVYGVFTFHEKKEIFDYIKSHISFSEMHPSILYNYTLYNKEIESYLLNNNQKGITTAEINLTTNVNHDDAEKLGVLLSTIEEILELTKSHLGEHRIECRHNSTEAISIFIQDIFPNLLFCIGTLYSVLMSYYTIKEKYLEIREKKINLKTLEQQNSKDLEIATLQAINLQLDNELKIQEINHIKLEQTHNNNLIKEEIMRKNIDQANIEIHEINHVIYGNVPIHADKSIIQFKYTKSQC